VEIQIYNCQSFHLMNIAQFRFIICFILLLPAGFANAQKITEERIKYIRNVYKEINSQKDLQQVKLEDEEIAEEMLDGGASLTGYFKDKKLLKIVQWIGPSYGAIQIEYYFNKNSLIFAYVTEKHFRVIGDSVDHGKLDVTFEGRYYYNKDKLISKTAKGNGFWIDADDGVQSLLPDSKTYLKLLYSKKNKNQ
jgi:hypothetical protein